MALLVFPPNPVNGQLYPTNPIAGQYQYQWSAADNTWRLLGAATGVAPGTYCPSTTSAPRITIDALGRITYAECVDLEFVRLNNSTAYNGYQWPNADGTPGQVLVTDGSGGLAWLTITSGGSLGSVSFVGTGVGLSGGPITSVGTINLDPATVTTLGGVIPDGTTITIDAAGVISAAVSPVGLGLEINGGFTKVAIPAQSPGPLPGTGQYEAIPGSLYWDNTLGELFIYYDDGITAQWVSANSSGAALPDVGLGLEISGTYIKVSIPTQSLPPTAGTAPLEAEPGSLYWDSDLGELFIYYNDGTTSQWVSTTGSSMPLPAPGFGIILQSNTYKTSIPALNGTPPISTAPTDAADGSMYYDTFLGAMFYRYNDGITSQWVQI